MDTINGYLSEINMDKEPTIYIVTDDREVLLNLDGKALKEISGLNLGSYITVEVDSDRVQAVRVVSKSPRPLPNISSLELDARIKEPWLKFRDVNQRNLYKLRTKLHHYFRDYFLKEGFIELISPKIVSIGLESNISAFEIDFFGQQACLSKGPQLYKTILLAGGIEKVFEIGPVFRKEKKFTPGHVAEFTAIDADFAYIDSVYEVMDVFEDILLYVFKEISIKAEDELKKLNADLGKIPDKIPRISIKEAYKILSKIYGKELKFGETLDKESERLLSKWIREDQNSDLLMVHDFPWSDRFFYYMKKSDDNPFSESFDILYKGIEIGTCARKEHRKDMLVSQAIEKGLDLEKLKHYLSIFDYSMPTYGGGGIGLDRLLQAIIEANEIREVIMFCRDPNSLNP